MKKVICIFFCACVVLCGYAQKADRLYNKGVHQAKKGDYQSAIASFSKALALSPVFPDAWYNRGLAKSKLRDFAGAIHDYTKAIAIRPNFPMAYNNRAADAATAVAVQPFSPLFAALRGRWASAGSRAH